VAPPPKKILGWSDLLPESSNRRSFPSTSSPTAGPMVGPYPEQMPPRQTCAAGWLKNKIKNRFALRPQRNEVQLRRQGKGPDDNRAHAPTYQR
jgi:hypothetical protein